MTKKLEVNILGWGAYIPIYRIKIDEICLEWGEDPSRWRKSLGLNEISVPALDEDSTTFAVEAARSAVKRAQISPNLITAIYVGTESKPYAVKPTATIVAAAINASARLSSADLEFACKAGTEAMRICIDHSLVNKTVSLAIGADSAQGKPRDALEYSAGAGAVAFIFSKGVPKHAESAAMVLHHFSYVTDTPDFWRCNGRKYPSHAERFTGAPAYFKHTINAAKGLMEEVGTRPSDYDHVVFHQPNGKFPLKAAKILGFDVKQLKHGFLADKIGNTYAANAMIGLASILDNANPDEKILMVSYGSGAGSDAFDMVIREGVQVKRELAPKVLDLISKKKYLTYGLYAKHKGKLIM